MGRQLPRRMSKKQSMRSREAARSVSMRSGEVISPSSVLASLRNLYEWIGELFAALDTGQDGKIDVAEAGAIVQRALTSEGLNSVAKVNLTGTFPTSVDSVEFVAVFLSWLGTNDTLADGLKDAGAQSLQDRRCTRPRTLYKIYRLRLWWHRCMCRRVIWNGCRWQWIRR